MTEVNKMRFNLTFTMSAIRSNLAGFFGAAPCCMRRWIMLI